MSSTLIVVAMLALAPAQVPAGKLEITKDRKSVV